MEKDKVLDSVLKKIGIFAAQTSEEMAKKHIPYWQQKIMNFTKGKRKKPLISFGYRIDIIQIQSLENDLIRAIFILTKGKKQIEAKEVRFIQSSDDIQILVQDRDVPIEKNIQQKDETNN